MQSIENTSISVDRSALKEDIIHIFVALGVSNEDAEMVAQALIKAEQWGVSSHGILRVERYVRCLQSGGIRANADLSIDKQVGCWALTSGNGGLGIPACTKASHLAVELARKHGVGVVNVRQSHHNGAEGIYTEYIAKQGMIGIVMSTGNPIMAITGASEPVIGNNPFSYAVPAGKHGTIMMDIAMSAVADGKVQIAKAQNKKLEPGCILDKYGQPSVEPSDYLNGGVLLPFGGHKGYGLAVMVECMAGIMSNAALTKDINSWNEIPGHCGNTGHQIIALDISQMMDIEEYCDSVEKMIHQFKNAKKAEGIEEVFYPGELEQRRLEQAGENVYLLRSTVESLCRAAKSANVVLQCISK